jgi:predicted permease
MWAWLAKARARFGRVNVDAELRAELDAHMQMEVEANLDRGMTPEDALKSARRAFGNPTLIQESSREIWMFPRLETILQDLRYGLRILRRSPGFALTAISAIALGVGANTAIFSLLDAVLLRTLPVAAPEELVLIDGQYENRWSLISYPMYRDLAERQQVFSNVVACVDYYAAPLRVRVGGSSVVRAVRGGSVSGNYFSTLGLEPALGRFFVPADDEPGRAAAVAVISYEFWQRELAGVSSVVGQTLNVGPLLRRSGDVTEEPFTVIGVAPKGFSGLSVDSALDVWVPLTKFRSVRELRNRDGTFFRLVGRLKPDVRIPQAKAAMTLLFQQLRADELQTRGADASSDVRVEAFRIDLQPGDRGLAFFRERLARPLTIIMAMAALLVVIVCMNLATLLSARATARQREITIRQALGASRGRLVQQLLTENVLLATLGGGLGLVFAIWASSILLGFVSTDVGLNSGFYRYVPAGLRFQLNLRVLAFTEGVALLAGVFLALAPALFLNRRDLITVLKQRIDNSPGLGLGEIRIPIRKILVLSQVAFSVVLLVGAGLMVRTVVNLRGLDPGFDPSNVLLVDFDVTGTDRTGAQLAAFERSLHERLNALPGVRSASLSWISPFGGSDLRMGVIFDRYTPARGDESKGPGARMDVVSAGYFETLGMTLVAGRAFTRRDDESAPLVAIVNESFVSRFFPKEDPIGQRFALRTMPAMRNEIVGVVKDAKYNDLRQSTREMFYLPLLQTPTSPARAIQIRTAGRPETLVQQIRQLVREADSNIVITESKTFADQVSRTLVRERLLADLSGFFGVAALLLSCIGLYSLLAYQVIQRTHEIGVRIALGSPSGSVMWLVVRDALLLVGLGVALGVPAALALSRSIASLLFGLSPTDPVTMAVVVMILLGVAGLSCYVPARRAAGVDPIIALRSE